MFIVPRKVRFWYIQQLDRPRQDWTSWFTRREANPGNLLFLRTTANRRLQALPSASSCASTFFSYGRLSMGPRSRWQPPTQAAFKAACSPRSYLGTFPSCAVSRVMVWSRGKSWAALITTALCIIPESGSSRYFEPAPSLSSERRRRQLLVIPIHVGELEKRRSVTVSVLCCVSPAMLDRDRCPDLLDVFFSFSVVSGECSRV
ncbi:hypothetical protein SCLCIDRAFT_995953 [Scleroderma citrinum Foug A]|uniref:Uncharacterized protein n=1 Tax=Scleroderma citrinum Foug A TaxID=1036808 RepID=A0A0C3DFQ6_9AGAM|nr:hypothetical protein SCLCIDRAFT_995953 [Scleroderma citrinum Foug A]